MTRPSSITITADRILGGGWVAILRGYGFEICAPGTSKVNALRSVVEEFLSELPIARKNRKRS